jgi:two-component system chemotaxis response regulator CheB
MMGDDRIGVLVVDDSALMRNVISRIVEGTPGLRLAEKAMNGSFALQKIPRCDPDVIVLDLEMPEMNGIEFLKERKARGIDIPVVILSSVARKGAQITMEALALGASDFIKKPSGEDGEDVRAIAEHLSGMLLAYGARYRAAKGKPVEAAPPHSMRAEAEALTPATAFAQDARLAPTKAKEPAEPPKPRAKPAETELIAIGISTGGPNALREVFSKIDPAIKQPIVVVQHMPPGFTAEFAKSLDRVCPLDVKEAEDGDLLKPGRILIAPGDSHLEVEKRALAGVARLSSAPPENGHRPSVDVLFSSVARHYGNKALAVIMTGMGRDGARELGSIYREGGITLGQDESSCVVYGMPRAAWEMGHVMEQVPLSAMAERISELARERR